MSIVLPVVNLATVSVGTTGTISLNNIGISAGGVSAIPGNIQYAGMLHIQNESGSGLLMSFQTSGDTFYLPAGAWTDRPIRSGEAGINYTVLYNLPSPPVTSLLVTYYGPNEKLPSNPTLGNSPIGIGGNVSTVGTATLSNEGNSSQTLIIDIGEVGHTLLYTLYSDGTLVHSVLQSGTAHQVFKTQIAGNPLLLGQAGDTSEVAGSFQVDQNFLVNNGGTVTLNSNGPVKIGAATAGVQSNLQCPVGTPVLTWDQNGFYLSHGSFFLRNGSMSSANGATSSAGSGTTISHGVGGTPAFVLATPDLTQAGSATVGVGNFTSTTFQCTVGAGSLICWYALVG